MLNQSPVDVETLRTSDTERRPHIAYVYGKMRLLVARNWRLEVIESPSTSIHYDYFRRVWNES